MQYMFIAKAVGGLAVAAGILSACVVVEPGPGMRPPAGPGGGICTREYAPVCGERRGDRQTFGNACVANSEGFRVLHAGECRRGGPPPGPQRICTQEYRPVCAERGRSVRTFGNACVAESEGYRVVRAGECRPGAGSPWPRG